MQLNGTDILSKRVRKLLDRTENYVADQDHSSVAKRLVIDRSIGIPRSRSEGKSIVLRETALFGRVESNPFPHGRILEKPKLILTSAKEARNGEIKGDKCIKR